MMRSTFVSSFLVIACFALFSCGAASPEKCFDVAVLNSNMIAGFAGEGLWRELESPSAKMTQTKDETVPMKCNEVLEDKIKFVEESLNKIQDLSQNDDNKDIVQASLALHQFVLPVYKTEYRKLAADFDGGISMEQAQKEAGAIHDKYFPRFESLYQALISSGKLYAAKHNINVKWDL